MTGVVETVVSMNGEKTVGGAVTDAETGQVLGLEALAERDSDGFMEWLGDFARDYRVEAMVADDLNTCKPVGKRLGVDHQICTARVKNRARNRLDRIDGWDWIKARIWLLLTELPFDVDLERSARFGTATQIFAACARSCFGSGGRPNGVRNPVDSRFRGNDGVASGNDMGERTGMAGQEAGMAVKKSAAR